MKAKILLYAAIAALLLLSGPLGAPASAAESNTMCYNASGSATKWVPCKYGADSGSQVAEATPTNSTHAAGTVLGHSADSGNQDGLLAIAAARDVGGGGIITNLLYKSNGGSTGAIVIRLWQKRPTATTCKDNTAFAGSDADDAFLVTAPITLSPSAPGSTTGDAATYATTSGPWDFRNADTTPTTNVYACVVTAVSDASDANAKIRLSLSSMQN